MSRYKCLSVCLILCLIFSGFSAPAEAALPESQAAQRTVQDSVPLTLQDKLFFVEDIPEIVGTETAAAELYTRRLREEERSLNEIVFRDTSGVNTLYLYSFPVKYVENGEIKDKTLELETLERGGKTLYRSADNDVVTTFSDQISDGIHLQHGEISITLKPEPSVKNSAPLKAETAFPAADRKSVAFLADQPVSGNVSLTYMGFSQELLIQERAGQNEFVSRIYTNGLELYQDDFGQLLLRGAEDDAAVAYVCDPVVFTADNRNNRLLTYTYETVVPNEEYILRLTLPADYLADESTVYPLSVNSGIEINTNGSIEDVTINSSAGSSGSSGSLYVGKRSSFGISRTLMKFPGLNLTAIDEAYQIISASVEIRDLLCESEAMTVNCHAFTGNTWSESSASWSSVSPNSYASSYTSRSVSYGSGNAAGDSQRYSFDITSIARGWKSGSYDKNKGVLFKAANAVESGGTYINKTFASSNHSGYRPCLKLEYSSISPTVTFAAREITMTVGNSRQLDYTVTPAGVGTINWVNLNSSALSLSQSGEVTAHLPGKYTVSIYLYYNGIYVSYDTCYITVLPQTSVPSGVYKIQNQSQGKYLTAKPNASVTLENGLSVGWDGSQLWFVENYGNFCMIYSLGLRDSSTHGEKEMVFSTNLSGNMVQLYSEIGNYNKWIVTKGNAGEYYISHYEVVNKGLRADGTSSVPTLGYIRHDTQETKWNLIPIEASSFNNYYGGSIEKLSGGRLYVKVEVDSSTYENEIYTASDVSSACSQWRGISARVVIYGPGDSVPSGVSPYVVRIKGTEEPLGYYEDGRTVVGKFYPKTSTGLTADIWDNYSRGEISLDVRSDGIMSGEDVLMRRSIIAHELGHALKMAHPHASEHLANVANGRGAYAIEGNVASIMNQASIYATNSNATVSPTTHDIINFKNKWGY